MNLMGVRRFRQLRAILKSLNMGTSIAQACHAASVTPVTFWNWRQRNERLEIKVNKIIESRTQMVEDALFKAALSGDVGAQREWLHNRAPEKWTADKKILINNNVNNTNTSSMNMNIVNLSEKELDDLADNIIAKRQVAVNTN